MTIETTASYSQQPTQTAVSGEAECWTYLCVVVLLYQT